MRRFLLLLTLFTPAAAQQPFTLQQILSAPYALSLTAAPIGARFAWIENAEGVRNIWVGGPNEPAHQITHYTDDDGQDISGLAWAPDATAIAYTYGAENGASGRPANPALLQRPTALQVIVQPLDAKSGTVIGEGRAPLFTSDGKNLLFLRGGQIWIANSGASDSQSHQLVYDRGSASQLTLSPDGKQLAFVSTRSHAGHTQSFIALFEIATKSLKMLAPSTQSDFAPTFSPDGKQIAWLRYPTTRLYEFGVNRISPNPWSIQLYDLNVNTLRTVFSPEPNKPGSVLPHISTGEPKLFFTANDRIIFFSETDGWTHLYTVDPTVARNTPQLLTTGNYEVEDVNVDSKNNFVLFSANDAGSGACARAKPPCITATSANDPLDHDRRHLWQIYLGGGAAGALGAFAFTGGGDIETHPVNSAGSIGTLASTSSLTMYAAYIDAYGNTNPLHALMPPAYPAAQLLTPQQVLFPSTDNLTIHGQLFLSPHLDPKTKHPAIIYMHGGPRRQMLLGYPASDYYSNDYAFNQYLASRGFIVLSVNYRCGIGYGLDFRECEHAGPTGAAEYADILAAQKYLASRPEVDTKRIGLWGGSYGGYLTALGLARNSDLFAAGVDFHGVHDWALEDDGTIWPKGATRAQADAADALAHASSPIADVAKWRSPVLFVHGDDDPDVAFAQTPMMADALRARGVHVEELIFPNEVHDFLLHKDWLAAFEAAADFFTRTLKP